MSYRNMQKISPGSINRIYSRKKDQKALVSQLFPLKESWSQNACQLPAAMDITNQREARSKLAIKMQSRNDVFENLLKAATKKSIVTCFL